MPIISPPKTWKAFLIELGLLEGETIVPWAMRELTTSYWNPLLAVLDELADHEDTKKYLTYLVRGHNRESVEQVIDAPLEEQSEDVRSLDNGQYHIIQNNLLRDPKYKERHIQEPYPSGREKSVTFPIRYTVYGVLCKYAYGNKHTCYPGIETISEEVGVDVRTVGSALKDLEMLGVIKIEPRYISSGRTSNEYTILNITPRVIK